MIYANIVERVKELNNDAWLSLVERCVRDAEVAGSNPVASMKKKRVHCLVYSLLLYRKLLSCKVKKRSARMRTVRIS